MQSLYRKPKQTVEEISMWQWRLCDAYIQIGFGKQPKKIHIAYH